MAEQPFGRLVRGPDNARQAFADDRVGGLDNGGQKGRPVMTRARILHAFLQLEQRHSSPKLDKFDLLILDDFAYVTKHQAETSVLFELISARYERRSLMLTANQPFGEWNRVFPDPAMTLAVVDRLVHHATIFEMNVESCRRRSAMEAKRQRGRPAYFATMKNAAIHYSARSRFRLAIASSLPI